MAFLGPPDRSVTQPDNTEVWYYYQANRSLFRKAPLVGEKLGYENYDVAVITFAGNRVLACVYRALTEDEFKKSGLVEEPAVEQ